VYVVQPFTAASAAADAGLKACATGAAPPSISFDPLISGPTPRTGIAPGTLDRHH
jgi:hypothetical protein